jgi:hypothetical protein
VLLFDAPPEGARGIEVTSGLEQRFESDCRIRIAAPARPLERRIGAGEIPAGRKEHAEAERRGWMAGCVGECVGTFCAGHVAAPFEQAAEVERPVGVAALAGALVAGLRLLQIAALLEEDPEVDRRGGMSQRICLPIRAFGSGQITALLEQQPEAEPLVGGTDVVNRCVCAPGHPHSRYMSFLSYTAIWNDRRKRSLPSVCPESRTLLQFAHFEISIGG